ncbi:Hypothetical predicted protein [Olea europaea subsp. europaea]|uniref:Uncharacterized protein n=1 Tax=Olea europaea subsp. europaea TaxID=158383 RepID=A0A8S0SDT6_OLEEU|nr:Hypothetical predicted protein [Olea europaea subsp. europaea]
MDLEHSSSSFSPYSVVKRVKVEDYDEENEDLSMISDASSRPPHLHEEDEFFSASIDATLSKINRSYMKNVKENSHRKVQEQPPLLDDTANSPIFYFSGKNFLLPNGQFSVENVLEYSQGHSTTQFEIF